MSRCSTSSPATPDRADLDDAERRVNDVYFAWRRGETPADAALDRALDEWRRLPEHGEMIQEWPRDVGLATH